MSSSKLLRWGICSAGKICVDFCAGLKILPETENKIVAVAAREIEKAQEFAKTYEIDNVYGSYQDLAKDETVDIVYIGTIHPYHAELSKLYLNAGKHVLCEKPMAMNQKQCRSVLELAKEKNLFFMEGFWTRFFPMTRKVLESIKNGDIGDVFTLSAEFGFNYSTVPRLITRELGGGVLMDMGCYLCMYCNMIFPGENPEKIYTSSRMNENGVDLTTSVTLEYSNGRMARLFCSIAHNLEETAIIHGSKGRIKINYLWCPTDIEINGEKIEDVDFPKAKHFINFKNGEGFSYEANCVRECILKGMIECPLMPHKDSLAISGLLERIRKQIGVHYPADDE